MILFYSSLSIENSKKVEFGNDQMIINGGTYLCKSNEWKFIVLKVSFIIKIVLLIQKLLQAFIFTFNFEHKDMK